MSVKNTMNKINKFIFLILFFLLSQSVHTQITLKNPSFEDEPADATVPMGWLPCERGSTPDILPGFWGVYEEASEGETFVGLISRENGTWESIGQRFSQILETEMCYKMSVDLSKSENYTGYDNPLKLRIWIGNGKCDKDQLIFESPLIDNSDWKTFDFEFIPESRSKYIILEAFHSEGKFSYKGNILIDNVSNLKVCSKA